MITKIMETPGATIALTFLVGVLMVYAADKALRVGKPPGMFRWFIPTFYTLGGAFLIVGVQCVVELFKG